MLFSYPSWQIVLCGNLKKGILIIALFFTRQYCIHDEYKRIHILEAYNEGNNN